jgi:orotidine-5'-phosphate decarboxylase
VNFADRLERAVAAVGTPALVGLDPHETLLPDEFAVARRADAPRAERAAAAADFCCALLDVVAGRVAAVKPQSAFFERFGADGAQAWERVLVRAHALGLLVIGDVKRGDIGSSASAYAQGLLGPEDPRLACDAITLNPLLGSDSIEPFAGVARAHGRGLFVLVRTSNPDSAMFQEHGTPPLSDVIARAVDRWGTDDVGRSGLSSVGAVVGATHPTELARLRALMPRAVLLLPGYGAQGAGAADVVPGFLDGRRGALVNSSRGISFAYRDARWRGRGWRDAAAAALDLMIEELERALAARPR